MKTERFNMTNIIIRTQSFSPLTKQLEEKVHTKLTKPKQDI